MNDLMLRNLPKWKCCEHCDDKYCPDRSGHYVACKQCGPNQFGKQLMEK